GFTNARIGIDVRGHLGCRVVEVFQVQGPVPAEVGAEPGDVVPNSRMIDPQARPRAAAHTDGPRLVTVSGKEPAALKYRVDRAEQPTRRLLNEDRAASGPSARRVEVLGQSPHLIAVLNAPHTSSSRAVGAFDVARIARPSLQAGRAVDQLGGW